MQSLFSYEFCSLSPSLIDEYGRLKKGSTATLVQRLGELQAQLRQLRFPDIVILMHNSLTIM